MGSRKECELKLWEVKEAAWKLYAAAFFMPGIPALVKETCRLVDEELKTLGYDPVVLVK